MDFEIDEGKIISQGAEGRLYKSDIFGSPCIVKERFVKKYRVPELDTKITKTRILQETRNMVKARKAGVNTPTIYFIDEENRKIYMELLESPIITVKEFLLSCEDLNQERITENLCKKIGQYIAKIHQAHIIHGDLTTSNMMVNRATLDSENIAENKCELYMIDFGLSYYSLKVEDKAVDLYVLKRAMISLHPGSEFLFNKIVDAYMETYEEKGAEIINRYKDVEQRGRKKLCFG